MIVTPSNRAGQIAALPSELTGTVPRDVRLSASGIAVAVVLSLMAVGALVSAIVMSIATLRAREPRERVTVSAQTLAVEQRRGEHPPRIVTYEPGGVPPWAVPLLSGALLAAAAGITWRLRRDWVLLSEGRAALARVTSQKKVHRDKHTAYEITSVFQDLSGATHTMRYDASKTPPPVGTLVAIVYHRDNPRWNTAYPLKFVRPSRAPVRARPSRGERAASFLAGNAQR
ncbi:MAG: hypothetical protein DMF86_22770 [Acidobacteria bacterium]|nr:MAG: hypothetical protein DMF86_22770 [Acidobacteriota bacterium]